jgi:hypothetical protein
VAFDSGLVWLVAFENIGRLVEPVAVGVSSTAAVNFAHDWLRPPAVFDRVANAGQGLGFVTCIAAADVVRRPIERLITGKGRSAGGCRYTCSARNKS